MAFRLDKKDSKRRAALVADLQLGETTLSKAVETFNTGLEALWDTLRGEIEKYNEIVSEARGFAEDIASQAENDIGEKTERWQESEKGQAAAAWQSEWENLSLNDVEIEYPHDVEIETGHADTLDGAPEASDE